MAPVGDSQATDDPLAALRERIRATAAAADRLATAAGAGDGPPPRTDEAAHEAQALVALLALLRDVVPPELRRQVADLVRQVLLLVGAVIDWWVARLEPGTAEAPAARVVEDIPLDA
jgi:hypothetical protein